MKFRSSAIFSLRDFDLKQDPINTTRVRILQWRVLFNIVSFLSLLIIDLFWGFSPTLIGNVVIIALHGALFYFINSRPQKINLFSHIIIIFLALVIWMTFLIFQLDRTVPIDILVFVQIVILSFFNLGGRWGTFYSLLAVVPIFLNVLLPDGEAVMQPDENFIRYDASYFVHVSYNCLFMLFVLWQIIAAFQTAIKNWVKTSNKLQEQTDMLQTQSEELQT